MTPDYRTHPDWADFCRKIGERPADDTARLVAADWLDETAGRVPCGACAGNGAWSDPIGAGLVRMGSCPACGGSGWVSDGRAERAELIRVQCRVAKLKRQRVERLNDDVDWEACTGIAASWCPNCGDCTCREPEYSRNDSDCPLHATGSLHCCLDMLEYKMQPAKERERGLLNAHGYEWAGSVREYIGPPVDWGKSFRRGFVAAVRGPLAALLDALPGLGAELWAVETATATDCEPWVNHDRTHWGWWERTVHSGPDTLPPTVMDAMDDNLQRNDYGIGVARRKDRPTPGGCILFRTESAARAALSAGILRLARERAGLGRPKARAGA